jgi:hypothetical protein
VTVSEAADVSAGRRFRKKPVVIEAMQWIGDYDALERLLGLNWGRADAKDVPWEHEDGEEVVVYNSAEKVWLPVPLDHWIIRGVQGEFYPCKPDIFEATYGGYFGGS